MKFKTKNYKKIFERLNSYSKSNEFNNQCYKYKKKLNDIKKDIAKGNIKRIDL